MRKMKPFLRVDSDIQELCKVIVPFINAAADAHAKVVFVGNGVCPPDVIARKDLKKRRKFWDVPSPNELAPGRWREELIATNACSVLKKRIKRWDVTEASSAQLISFASEERQPQEEQKQLLQLCRSSDSRTG